MTRSATSVSDHDDLPMTLAASVQLQFGDHAGAIAQLAHEMNWSWQQGRRLSAHDLLGRHPELRQQRDAVLRLVCEELCLRRECGLTVSPDAWKRHFPEWRDDLDALFENQRLIEPGIVNASNPFLGMLHDFRLLAELGQGGQGQVYLASQPHLADRPVVVKVTTCRGNEHLALARLQHTYIVPLLSAHESPENDQRILCMPYFGNVTLAHVLAQVQHVPCAQRTGRHILEALDRTESPVPISAASRRPARRLLARANYAQAIAWMGACLADALGYAHERDLLHLDIKPSNVLWTQDGQPMLLDFHLARPPIRARASAPRGIGGTPMWMAPELETAVNAAFEHQPIPCDVDARADTFELGLLLYHALGGCLPLDLNRPTRLESINAQVSPGLADIVHRCLARDPSDRYATAEHLATDLRRHLNDLPLCGVPNRSVVERWQKWRRRRPHAMMTCFLAALVVAMLGAAGGWWQWRRLEFERQHQEQRAVTNARVERAEKLLTAALRHLDERKYELALITLENGKALLPDPAEFPALYQALCNKEQFARRQHAQQVLRDGVNALRAAAVAESLTHGQTLQLEVKCRELWEQREWIVPKSGPADEPVRRDMIDLTVIWADLSLRLTPGADGPGAARRLIAVLAEIEQRCGGSVLLDDLRERLRRDLGEGASSQPRNKSHAGLLPMAAWEHVARARQFLHNTQRRVVAASSISQLGLTPAPLVGVSTIWTGAETFPLNLAAWHLEQAIALEPDLYWAHFYQGVAAYRMHRPTEAVLAFRVCIALQPRQAAGYHNRALAAAAGGHLQQALADYTKAIELEPQFVPSALNRALVKAKLRDYDGAAADLRWASKNGADHGLVQANLQTIERLRRAAAHQ